MRLVLLSDTHGLHKRVQVLDGDVLLFAGDMSMSGSYKEIAEFAQWFGNQPHKHKLAIAGNHDWLFQRQPEMAREILANNHIGYLEDSGTEIDGISFYGSPQTPFFLEWAFNVPRGPCIRKYWNMIPDSVDVLITHGPVWGILDQASPRLGTEHLGCEELLERVQIVRPKLHLFGHIHGSSGSKVIGNTVFVNASIVNEAYGPANTPRVFDL